MAAPSELRLRRARSDEVDTLTELAMRAKASWGYDAAFMAACRAELTMTPEKLAAWEVWVAELDGRVTGMVALRLEGDAAEVEDFFVEAEAQGRGVGRALIDRLLATCRDARVTAIGVDADPHAEAIYGRFGFVTVGRSPSGSIPGRLLPRMELRLE